MAKNKRWLVDFCYKKENNAYPIFVYKCDRMGEKDYMVCIYDFIPSEDGFALEGSVGSGKDFKKFHDKVKELIFKYWRDGVVKSVYIE